MAKRSFRVIKREIQNYSSSLSKVLYSSFYLRKKDPQTVPKRASEGKGIFQVRVKRSPLVPSGSLPCSREGWSRGMSQGKRNSMEGLLCSKV